MKSSRKVLFNQTSSSLMMLALCAFATTMRVHAQTQMPPMPGAQPATPPTTHQATTAQQETTAPQEMTAAQAKTALPPKKAGMVRIGVAMPKAQMSQPLAADIDPATALRNSIVKYLSGPVVEVVALGARIPAQLEAEAKQQDCDFILYTNYAQKKGGGGSFGKMMSAAAPVANVLPMNGMGGNTAGAVAGAVATTAIYTAATMSSSVKAKDEISIEYKLVAPGSGSTPRLANKLKAKAKQDGEDVISPLIEQEAGAVLAEAAKK